MVEYGAFSRAAASVLRGGNALYPTSTATTVRISEKGGDVVASDGPYAETKEALTGIFLLECADLDEEIAKAALIPAAWNGAVELRPKSGSPGCWFGCSPMIRPHPLPDQSVERSVDCCPDD